jgi:glycerate 2-kinase
MRVLVATDAIGELGSLAAGRAIAAGWADADVKVQPVGEAGAGFLTAFADQVGGQVESTQAGDLVVTRAAAGRVGALGVRGAVAGPGIPHDASSIPIGAAVQELLSIDRLSHLLLDIAGLWVHDGGAGLLAGLGARADVPLDQGVRGLAGIGSLDLGPARAALEGVELIGVAPAAERSQPLLGLRGITSLRGRSAGIEPGLMLGTDRMLERFASRVAPGLADAPGAGACGGLGFAVLALGGRLTTGPAVALRSVDTTAAGPDSGSVSVVPGASVLARRSVDLVVTGCSVFDFAARGGGVVAAAAEVASVALAPCIVIAGEVVIGAREMRTMGIEAAYAVRDSTVDQPLPPNVTADQLAELARRVARSWTW